MADKQKTELERIYTIPLRKVKTSPRNHRSDRAVRAVKAYLSKHMKSEQIWIDGTVNEKLWARGMYQTPSRIRVRALKFDDGVVEVTLPEADITTSRREEIKKRREDAAEAKDKKADKKEKGSAKEAEAKKEWLAAGPPAIEVEGIGPVYADKLKAMGITTTRQLKEADAEEVAKKTEAPAASVHQWQSMAALMEIKGVGKQFAELLVKSGIHSEKELGSAEPEMLLAKIQKTEAGREVRIQGAPVALANVEAWVEAAKKHKHDAWVKKADAEDKPKKEPAAKTAKKETSAKGKAGAKAEGSAKSHAKKD